LKPVYDFFGLAPAPEKANQKPQKRPLADDVAGRPNGRHPDRFRFLIATVPDPF